MAVDQEGQLLVADTHYNRVLIYSLAGQLHEERTIGGQPGTTPGMFAFVTDVTRDSRGNYYVGDYGDADRVQQFSPERQFIAQWGGTGSGLEELIRPQSLIIDRQDQLWVADACNHRIKAFDTKQSPPKQIACWGTQGSEPGEINYPYGIAFDAEENLWVCEYGNQRIQQFTKDGRSLRIWGSPGKLPGQLYQPWGLVCDRRNRMHILDSNNHRVQRIQL